MYTYCLQLTGDIHEEVESQNRLLDRMVYGLYFLIDSPKFRENNFNFFILSEICCKIRATTWTHRGV
jgi:hypothetical protein